MEHILFLQEKVPLSMEIIGADTGIILYESEVNFSVLKDRLV